MTAEMTDRQRELSRHALGLPNDRRVTYRNRFIVGPGMTNFQEWEDLAEKGLAVKSAGETANCYQLTLAAARMVLHKNERICREDADHMRTLTPWSKQ